MTKRVNAGAPPSLVGSATQTYVTNLAAAVVSLGNVLIIARALGAEGRGHVAFLTAIAWLMSSLSTLGVQEANANFAAARSATRRSLATNSVLFSLLLGGLAIGVLAGLLAAFPAIGGEADGTLLWITLAFLPVLILQTLLRFLAQADYAFTITNAVFLLTAVLNAAINALFAAFGTLSVATAVGVWIGGQTLATTVLAWYVARRLAGFGRPDLGLARDALVFGAKAHAGRVMQLGNYRLDQWLLGAIAGPRELGLYSVAVAWAEALWFLPTALASVQRPRLVRAGPRQAASQAAVAFRATTVFAAVTALGMLALASPLCVIVFGKEFRGSIDDLRVLVAGVFGMAALKLFGNALVAQGRAGLQSLAIGAGFLLTVLLDILLIPPLGGLGAALASTLAYTAAGVVIAAIFLHALPGRASDLVPRAGDLKWILQKVRDLRRAGTPEQTTIAP